MKRPLRILIGVTLTALATAYILLKIDLGRRWDDAQVGEPLVVRAGASTIMVVTALPMALRWQWLLAAQGMHRPASGG